MNTTSFQDVLEEIKERMKDRGQTQSDMAEELGVSREQFNRRINDNCDMEGFYFWYLLNKFFKVKIS